MAPFHRRFFRAALLFAALAFTAPFVWARAGGGHSYSGGSSGGGYSGSGSRSGGGGGDLILLWWLLVSRYPLVGYPVTLFAVYLLFKSGQSGQNRYVGRTIRRGVEAQADRLYRAGLEKLRERDPAFDEKKFLARVQDGFLKTQNAWARQDMRPVRAFLSDGVFERFEIYLTMQKALGFRNAMESVRVSQTRIVQIESDAHFDALHVRIDASSIDFDVNLEGGRILRNEMKRSEAFTEIWSFLRRPGAKTLAKPGLMEGACPNCGAPLSITDAAKCASCDSWVNSGEYDWVLSEITQACEWRPLRENRQIPGRAEMEALDPALSVQFLEDRVSVAFWRWQLAHWEEDAGSFSSVASEAMQKEFLAQRTNGRLLYKNAAVGGVETLALEPSEPLDRAHVLVRWSASKYSVVEGEARPEGEAVCSHVFVLGRNRGVKTDPRSGLRSARCPGCGAPPSGRAIAVCEYCSTPFNDGSRSWSLLAIVPRGLWKPPSAAPFPRREKPAAPVPTSAGAPAWDDAMSPSDALAILVAGMAMDGRIEPREVQFAKQYAQKNAIPDKRIDTLVASARAGTLEVPRPVTARQATDYMRGLIDMSLADGLLSGRERQTLLAFGERMNLAKSDVERMVNAERARLYREAKDALKRSS